MAAEKLTQALLSNYPRPTAGTVRIRDSGVRGLYAYIGAKSIRFVLRREVDGVTKPLKLGDFPAMTVMQARQAAEKINSQINSTGSTAISNAIAKRSAPTLATALSDYIRIRQSTGVKPMRDTTASSMRDYFNSYLEDWLPKKVSMIRTADIVARHLLVTENNGPYAANRAMDYLSSVLGWAIYHYAPDDDHPLLPDNPVKVLTRRRQWNNEVRRQTYVAPAALPQFWQTVQELPEKAQRYHTQALVARDCLIVSLFTGMRPYEVQRLRIDGVDLKKSVLRLEDTKNHDTFEIPFGRDVFVVLKRRVEYAIEIGSDYVFPSSGTNPRSRRSTIHMRSYVDKIDEALGGFVSKDLRRTFETLVGNMSPPIPLMIQKRLLNHRTKIVDPDDVTAGYFVADPEEVRPHVERIAERILQLVKGEKSQPTS